MQCPGARAANAGVVEHVVAIHGLVGSSFVTAQVDFTEVPQHAHGSAALEIQAAAVFASASVSIDAGFQHKLGLQAVAQIFLTAQTEVAVRAAAGVQTRPCLLAIDHGHSFVQITVEVDGRLCKHGTGGSHRDQRQRSDDFFLHVGTPIKGKCTYIGLVLAFDIKFAIATNCCSSLHFVCIALHSFVELSLGSRRKKGCLKGSLL